MSLCFVCCDKAVSVFPCRICLLSKKELNWPARNAWMNHSVFHPGAGVLIEWAQENICSSCCYYRIWFLAAHHSSMFFLRRYFWNYAVHSVCYIIAQCRYLKYRFYYIMNTVSKVILGAAIVSLFLKMLLLLSHWLGTIMQQIKVRILFLYTFLDHWLIVMKPKNQHDSQMSSKGRGQDSFHFSLITGCLKIFS